MNNKAILAITVSILFVLVLNGCKQKQSETKSEQETRQEKPATEFTLKSYDGTQVSLADYKGKIIVLEWFNYECPFCKYHYETETTMTDLAKKYIDKGVVFLAINSTSHQETEKNKNYAKEYKIPYPILEDHNGKVGRAYKAKTTPHMFIINSDGLIVYDGAIDNTPLGKEPEDGAAKINYIDKALSEILSGQKISISNTKPYGCSVKYAN